MVAYILLALGGVGLIFFLLFRGQEGGIVPLTLKTVTSLLFVGTAIASIVGNYSLTGTITFGKLAFEGLIVMGLVLGLIGDVALDLKITYIETNLRHSDLYTYMGISAFGVGHIFFVVAIATYFGFSPWVLLIAACATAAIFAAGKLLVKMNFGKFFIPCVAYAFLLTLFISCAVVAGIMTSFSLSIVLLITSSSLFLGSNLILCFMYFDGNDSRVVIIIENLLYYAAQFLTALSLYYLGTSL